MILEIGIILFTIALDLVSKSEIFKLLSEKGEVSLLGGLFTLIPVYNDGATFGIFAGNKFFLLVLPIIICIILFVILIYRHAKNKTLLLSDAKYFFVSNMVNVGIALVIGGGIGNLYDRFKFNAVRDFIKYDFFEKIIHRSFAIGNIADLCLMFGVFIIVVYLLISIIKEIKGKCIE